MHCFDKTCGIFVAQKYNGAHRDLPEYGQSIAGLLGGRPQDALFACNLILQLANYCYVCVAGLPEADRQTAFACCCLLYRRWATKLPDPRTLPYAVRLAQRALEQADYGLWQLQGRLFQLIN